MTVLVLALSVLSLVMAVLAFVDVRRVAAVLQKHKDAILNLQDELDVIASTGPGNFKDTSPKAADGNRVKVPRDGLPLTGHTVIVGKSGSGKTNVAELQIMHRINAEHDVYIIDTKYELGPMFKNHVVKAVDTEGAAVLLEELTTIAKDRQNLFAVTMETLHKPCRNHGEYFKLTGSKLPIVSLFVEELIALMAEVDEAKLIKLLVMGRSAGVYVVALAQYLTADTLSRKGSINFNTKVYLGQYDRISCGILFPGLDKSDVQLLTAFLGSPGKGVIEEEGHLTTRTFPEVTSGMLESFMQ